MKFEEKIAFYKITTGIFYSGQPNVTDSRVKSFKSIGQHGQREASYKILIVTKIDSRHYKDGSYSTSKQ